MSITVRDIINSYYSTLQLTPIYSAVVMLLIKKYVEKITELNDLEKTLRFIYF